jgi:hypothetical protein
MSDEVIPAWHACRMPGCWDEHGWQMCLVVGGWRRRYCTLPRSHRVELVQTPHRYDGRLLIPTWTRDRLVRVALPCACVGTAVGLLAGLVTR